MKSAQKEDSLLVKHVADPGTGGVLNSDIALPQSECDCTVRQTGFSLSFGTERYSVMCLQAKNEDSLGHVCM